MTYTSFVSFSVRISAVTAGHCFTKRRGAGLGPTSRTKHEKNGHLTALFRSDSGPGRTAVAKCLLWLVPLLQLTSRLILFMQDCTRNHGSCNRIRKGGSPKVTRMRLWLRSLSEIGVKAMIFVIAVKIPDFLFFFPFSNFYWDLCGILIKAGMAANFPEECPLKVNLGAFPRSGW